MPHCLSTPLCLPPSGRAFFLRVLLPLLLTLVPGLAHAQGAPTVVWARAGHYSPINGVALTPDGRYLISTEQGGDRGAMIKIHHLPDGLLVKSWPNPGQISSAIVSPDGTKLVTVAYSGSYLGPNQTVLFWSIPDGKLLWTYQGFTGGENYGNSDTLPTFSADGSKLYFTVTDPANGNYRNTIGLNTADGTLFGDNGYGRYGFSVAASNSAAPLLIEDDNGGYILADPNTLANLSDINFSNITYGGLGSPFALSPDGSTFIYPVEYPVRNSLAVGLVRYDTASGRNASYLALTGDPDGSGHLTLPGFYNEVWTDPGSIFLSGTIGKVNSDSSLTFYTIIDTWNISSGDHRRIWTSPTPCDGSHLENGPISTWPTQNATLLAYGYGEQSLLNGSPTLSRLGLINISDGSPAQYTDATGVPRPAFAFHGGPVTAVAYSPDGKTLATASIDSTFKLWRASDGALLGTVLQQTTGVQSLSFSPDGRRLVATSGDNAPGYNPTPSTPTVWDITNPASPVLLYTINTACTQAAFSPDGTKIATKDFNQVTLSLFNASDGTFLTSTSVGGGAFAFSPDGKQIAVNAGTSGSFSIGLYDSTTLALLRSAVFDAVELIRGGSDYHIAFSADGSHVGIAQEGAGATKIIVLKTSDLTGWSTPDSDNLGSPNRGIAFDPSGQYVLDAPSPVVEIRRVSDGTVVQTYDQETGPAGIFDLTYSPDGKTFAYARLDNAVVVAQNPFHDWSSQVTVARGGYVRTSHGTTFSQQVTLTNTGTSAITGPISLVLDSLTSATLTNETGTTTSSTGTPGSPYFNGANSLAPNASVSVTLRFNDLTQASITYQTRVLAGTGTR